jgi:hypothetical protein
VSRVVVVLLALLGACRTNQLAIYAGDAVHVAVVDAPAPGLTPIVSVEEPLPTDGTQALANVVGGAVAGAVQNRLRTLASPETVTPVVVKRVIEGVATFMPKATVLDPAGGNAASADVRLEITVQRYGVTVAGGSAYAWMNLYARMVHLQAGKIWESTENVTVPLSSIPALVGQNPAGSLVATSALAGLSDPQWRDVFDQLAVAGGDAVLTRIRLDAVK